MQGRAVDPWQRVTSLDVAQSSRSRLLFSKGIATTLVAKRFIVHGMLALGYLKEIHLIGPVDTPTQYARLVPGAQRHPSGMACSVIRHNGDIEVAIGHLHICWADPIIECSADS